MTAGTVSVDRFAPLPASLLRRGLAGPRQGWLTVLLVGVMVAVVGGAIEDSRWIGTSPTGASQTAWLPMAMLLAAAFGLLAGVSRISTAAAHLASAFVGVAVILINSASSISSAPTLTGRLQDLSESFGAYVNDVLVMQARSVETAPFLILIAAISWATAYFAAFNVYRRTRGMPAVIACGLVLLVNMSITARFQYVHLIVLTLASMLLLVRLNVVEQSVGWRRRHIGDGEDVAGLFLRGGSAFVSLTMIGALLLAATASSAPLAGFWRDMDDQIASLTVEFNRIAGGVTGATKQAGGLFGTSTTIKGIWQQSNAPQFSYQTSDGSAPYFLGAVYDDFDGLTWSQSPGGSTTDVAAGKNVFAGTAEAVSGALRTPVQTRVTSIGLIGGFMLAPETVTSVDKATRVVTAPNSGPAYAIKFADSIDPGQQYTVTSLVPDIEAGGRSGLTGNQLAAAGTAYPDWVSRYIAVRSNSVGQIGIDTAQKIRDRLPADQRDPYHIAVAMQTFFDSTGGFTYNTNVVGVCGRESIVDCLLLHRVGYCEHYATTMTMLLRWLGIPARYVEGFLPGKLLPDGVTRQVDLSAAHAWVEVYFPGYGWVRFDPTPGNTDNGRAATTLPEGPPVTPGGNSAGPTPTPGDGNIPPFQIPNEDDPGTAPLPAQGAPDPGGIAILAVLILVVAGVGLALYARRRRSPGLTGTQTFDRVARLAARLGYAPRPSQTAYEYAGTLSDVVPSIRQELHVVAQAKVESTYARREPSMSAIRAIADAYARIRRGLLRLFFRRKPGRGNVAARPAR